MVSLGGRPCLTRCELGGSGGVIRLTHLDLPVDYELLKAPSRLTRWIDPTHLSASARPKRAARRSNLAHLVLPALLVCPAHLTRPAHPSSLSRLGRPIHPSNLTLPTSPIHATPTRTPTHLPPYQPTHPTCSHSRIISTSTDSQSSVTRPADHSPSHVCKLSQPVSTRSGSSLALGLGSYTAHHPFVKISTSPTDEKSYNTESTRPS